MAKHARKVQQALRARQSDVKDIGIPNTGRYPLGNGKTGFFTKPGSQNKKKGYGKRRR